MIEDHHGHRSGDSDLLKKIITGDETWVYGYDIKTKPQSENGKPFATIEEIKELWVYGCDIETKTQSSQWKAFYYD